MSTRRRRRRSSLAYKSPPAMRAKRISWYSRRVKNLSEVGTLFLCNCILETFRRLEGRDVVRRDDDARPLRHVLPYFLGTVLHAECTESTQEHFFAIHYGLTDGVQNLVDSEHDGIPVHATLVRNFLCQICFCHSFLFFMVGYRTSKYIRLPYSSVHGRQH